MSKDEMAGWNHQCSGHELGQTSGDGEGQGGLACCSPWGRKQSDMTWQLNSKRSVCMLIRLSPFVPLSPFFNKKNEFDFLMTVKAMASEIPLNKYLREMKI